jgi:hypothetical protein
VVKTGEGGVNVLERNIMLFASYPGTKMHHASLLEIKVNNRRCAQITNMRSGKGFFAVHAGKGYNLILDQFQAALFVEASIRGTKVNDSLLFVLFKPQFNTWTAF